MLVLWNLDRRQICPSLYAGRKRSAAEDIVVEPPAVVPAPATGSPEPATAEPAAPAGLPGASPFTNS